MYMCIRSICAGSGALKHSAPANLEVHLEGLIERNPRGLIERGDRAGLEIHLELAAGGARELAGDGDRELARGGRSGLAVDGARELAGDGRSGLRLDSVVNYES